MMNILANNTFLKVITSSRNHYTRLSVAGIGLFAVAMFSAVSVAQANETTNNDAQLNAPTVQIASATTSSFSPANVASSNERNIAPLSASKSAFVLEVSCGRNDFNMPERTCDQ